MKKSMLKSIIKAATVIVFLLTINDGMAQRFERRLPHKPLKLEAIEEETKQEPIKMGSTTKTMNSTDAMALFSQQELIYQKVSQVLALVRTYKKESWQ